jgi:phosphoglycolate phosphatase-like HAD superfamily hydrolase
VDREREGRPRPGKLGHPLLDPLPLERLPPRTLARAPARSTYWYELDRDDYGLLQRAFQDSELIDEILHRLKSGQENLDVLNWAIDTNQPMDEVLEILEKLDINPPDEAS